MVSDRESMEAGDGLGSMCVDSTATTPDQITEQWLVSVDGPAWVNAPKVRVRVCSSVEKHAAEQRVEQGQRQALKQAQQSRRLVVDGIADDFNRLIGVYALEEGKVVSGRAVWQKQDEGEETFLYCSGNGEWVFSDREGMMEPGKPGGFMSLSSAALTPDQARPSEVWEVSDGTKLVASSEVQVRRQ
jgi:hypothetical protein